MKFLFAISFSFLMCQNASALSTEELYKDLNSAKKTNFKTLVKNNTVSVLFQPNCSSCKKQIKSLHCLPQNTEIVLVGSLGTEDKVKQAYLKITAKVQKKLPGFYVRKQNLEKIGFNSNLAPQTIIYSEKGSKKFLGFKSCKTIKKVLEDINA